MTATIGSTDIGLTEVQLLVATLIDVMVTDPAQQGATLDFNIANAPAACTSGSGSSAEP